ncbi:O-acetyl-ADP-ribose deacetylase [Tissierella carlieri]|jgi:O-acetyl-ADP-ribose deacetylase (regulator of RNase III)|uniref:O-acetyl-ADP-ribose deacetylase n=1 Tax=Tissierella TaxID=41273 RepID=UPI002805012D|nr:O-acetyl-ADP-ribose deacetylase [uncultured Tissierella sp.]MDU5081195.1 O-acetyl-ADP-ribose deacetylase [Bacillota bacterium]
MFKYKEAQIKTMLGDITKIEADAIVNAANNTLLGGGGVDGAIHRVGGKRILEQCKKIGGCPTGEARITTAGDLPSKYVIHTVGPIYKDGISGEEKLLYNAYYSSLNLAKEYNIKTIAFPSISTGAYGYPIEKAMKIAIKSVIDFIDKEETDLDITFVLFNNDDFLLYNNYLNEKLLQF